MRTSTILSTVFAGVALALHSSQLASTVELLRSLKAIADRESQSNLVARDFDDFIEHEGALYVRAPRGSLGKVLSGAKTVGKAVNTGSEVAGNVGTALTGVSNFVGLFKGNKQGKRDLEGLDFISDLVARDYLDDGLYIRSPQPVRKGVAAVGKGVYKGSQVAGNVGDALTGVSDFVKLFKGGKRDLEDVDFELLARDDLDME